jgi:hypothetical protein
VLLTKAKNGGLEVTSIATGRVLQTLPVPPDVQSYHWTDRALSPDGLRAVVGVSLVDLQKGTVLVPALLPAEENLAVTSAAFSPDSRFLAITVSGIEAGSTREGLLLFDGRTGSPLPSWQGHQPWPFGQGSVPKGSPDPEDPAVPPAPPPARSEGSLLSVRPRALKEAVVLERGSYLVDLPRGATHRGDEGPFQYAFDSAAEYSSLLLRDPSLGKNRAADLQLLDGQEDYLPVTPDVEEHVVQGPHGVIAERCSRPARGRLTCRLEVRLPGETIWGVLRDVPDAALPLFSAIVRSVRARPTRAP